MHGVRQPQKIARFVLGIDPGLDRTGYAVIDASGPRVLDAGLIRSSSEQPLERRLVEIEAGLNDLLEEHTVELVAVEQLYAHYKHPRTAILMHRSYASVRTAGSASLFDRHSSSALSMTSVDSPVFCNTLRRFFNSGSITNGSLVRPAEWMS